MKPLILVSNDDSITSRGIKHLVEIAKEFGEVMVVAPHYPQSAKGHAITIASPLRLYPNNLFGDDVVAYSCDGTPVDCIKLAKNHLLKNQTPSRVPDLVLSGMNHGSNTSISVIYSGTMGAAIEAAIEGIPSVGFSLCDYDHNGELSHTTELIRLIIKQVLTRGLPQNVALNVNFPKFKGSEIKGIKVCRQAHAKWDEKFDERTDPYNGKYYWMAGDFMGLENNTDTDDHAISNYYASLVPCQYDMTAYKFLESLKDFEGIG
jgi:5'-nucleotidase